ncbi:hypothetical protein PRIPAC_86353 [Pristionchus pacificus]|uniref:Uncharacterized protein n=1 Tax=Pristionchus pacificus TaxID=54126 RepID=A0A2A6BL14_PRIPA|nr:hypothetical protein PRIPAC_86353 [Pristionchus pacificus]|eukprot:PDM66605.1 hypothetical protein PRIPAC_48022 [Pristionchus pacificus]
MQPAIGPPTVISGAAHLVHLVDEHQRILRADLWRIRIIGAAAMDFAMDVLPTPGELTGKFDRKTERTHTLVTWAQPQITNQLCFKSTMSGPCHQNNQSVNAQFALHCYPTNHAYDFNQFTHHPH